MIISYSRPVNRPIQHHSAEFVVLSVCNDLVRNDRRWSRLISYFPLSLRFGFFFLMLLHQHIVAACTSFKRVSFEGTALNQFCSNFPVRSRAFFYTTPGRYTLYPVSSSVPRFSSQAHRKQHYTSQDVTCVLDCRRRTGARASQTGVPSRHQQLSVIRTEVTWFWSRAICHELSDRDKNFQR